MNTIRLFLAAGLMAAAATASAQPGRGPCAAAAGASGATAADCPASGAGMRGGMGPRAHAGRDYTPGWPMMSRAERRQHHQQMASLKNHEECKAYMDKHHEAMVARAKERGIAMPAQPRRDACAGLKPAAGTK